MWLAIGGMIVGFMGASLAGWSDDAVATWAGPAWRVHWLCDTQGTLEEK